MDEGIERDKTWIQTGRLAVTVFCSVHGESVLAWTLHYRGGSLRDDSTTDGWLKLDFVEESLDRPMSSSQ
jgi:hypothetical protein